MKRIKSVRAIAPSFSKTRNCTEMLEIEFRQTHALVISESGEEYVVTRTSCTCPDHFHRRRTCRHMEAVFNAVEVFKHW